MSDDDDLDFASTNQSSRNLASVFQGGEPAPTIAVATTAYVPPKQPKKDSQQKVMIASVIQAFSLGVDQKWTSKGKMAAAILSNDNKMFQLIIYLTHTQQITSARINTSSVFTPQSNNYLSFQDDGGQNWSIMFDNTQAIVDFAFQIILAKAYLFSFKFDYIIQEIRDGEGPGLVDQDIVQVTVNLCRLLENGTIQPADAGENKPVKFKIGKNQNGKAFDDVLRGMKKSGQRLALIGTTFYNIEVVRIKREKEAGGSSAAIPTEEQTFSERKKTITEDNEASSEKNKMLQRIGKMGGVSMIQTSNLPSAFAPALPPQSSDDDSITNEYMQNMVPPRSITTPVQPVQFVQPGYHHLHSLHPQPLIQHPNLYSPQPSMHDYNNRPGSSTAGMGYQPVPMWPHSQYPPSAPNIPPTDMFYQQQQQQSPYQPDVRQLMNRLNEKVDILNEKFDAKISPTHPNMETSILLTNIQRIVKENENMKKDLYDRSAKVEELNLKISELLDRNQKLIEQSHQTFEQRNVSVNSVSEQTAQKFLELEKQKVELTNNLSVSTSKIADLQLQINQYTQDHNENQSRISSLLHRCEQYKEDLQKSENQRSEIQTKFDTNQEQLKYEKNTRKQLQTNLSTLEEESTELKITNANFEKIFNERKNKFENERKRWLDDIEEQKQSYEKELDELRIKLRKQRTNDSLTNNQEISRIEQDLEKEWQEKFERQQTQHERLLNSKVKELEQFKILFDENQTKLQELNQELNESKEEIQAYEERCEKLQERLSLMKEKLIEINDEQPQIVNDAVKSAINIIFQRLKTRIQPTKQYTGEQFLSRSLEIIKKATLKILSNNDGDEPSSDEIQSEEENEQIQSEEEKEQIQSEKENEQIQTNDEPVNGNSVDQQTLIEEVSSIQTEEKKSLESEILSSTNNQNNYWDTVDDLPEQSNTIDLPTETSISSNPPIENNQTISSLEITEEEHDSDGSADTIEENVEKPSLELEIQKEKSSSDENEEELFHSARPSIQDIVPPPPVVTPSVPPPTNKLRGSIPILTKLDDSDDEMFK